MVHGKLHVTKLLCVQLCYVPSVEIVSSCVRPVNVPSCFCNLCDPWIIIRMYVHCAESR